ncbi:hypothetical protein [Streptomyces luteogriseus]|uniref:hypothetical protein n=1 Tax=Streptomyces luteogriseus TaxID=68233 RepID=UPI00381F65AC
MAQTFDELVTMQRTSDGAHAKVQQLQVDNGRITANEWTEDQHTAWRTAWKAWVDAAGDIQAAVSEHAREQGIARNKVEEDVKKAARHTDLTG